MTLEELKNKKVTITVNETFKLGEDLNEDTLKDFIHDLGDSDAELLKAIIDIYYSTRSDIEDLLCTNDYKVTIHD